MHKHYAGKKLSGIKLLGKDRF